MVIKTNLLFQYSRLAWLCFALLCFAYNPALPEPPKTNILYHHHKGRSLQTMDSRFVFPGFKVRPNFPCNRIYFAHSKMQTFCKRTFLLVIVNDVIMEIDRQWWWSSASLFCLITKMTEMSEGRNVSPLFS